MKKFANVPSKISSRSPQNITRTNLFGGGALMKNQSRNEK
jgi:hypothetical protein